MNRSKVRKCLSLSAVAAVMFLMESASFSHAQGSALSDRVFVVETGQAGEGATDKDVYIFLDGKFLSTGFQLFHGLAPGVYSERAEGETVTFAAAMTGTSGEMVRWEGRVQGEKIAARFFHQSVRKWYRPNPSLKECWARTITAAPEPVLPGQGISHSLDGKSFLVKSGAKGKPAEHEDYLVFWDGKYVSSDCFPYGFGIASYSTTVDQDGIRFHAETRSATQGRLIYDGVVRGDTIEVTSRWLHKRWLWKIDREYWYKGSLFK